MTLEWEDRELLRRGVEALESIAASLVRMNKFSEEGLRISKDDKIRTQSALIKSRIDKAVR